ncbi:MAG: hypothetical protein WCK70_03375, partial [Chloroflexales bacterium]
PASATTSPTWTTPSWSPCWRPPPAVGPSRCPVAPAAADHVAAAGRLDTQATSFVLHPTS